MRPGGSSSQPIPTSLAGPSLSATSNTPSSAWRILTFASTPRSMCGRRSRSRRARKIRATCTTSSGGSSPASRCVQAQDDLRRALLQLKSTYPDLWNKYESVRVLDFHDSLVGQMRPALEILMGAVGLVLVIVSANILSLLLTRSIARRREMGLRAALGASGWRILRQLLVENAVLCILGGALGVLLAGFATPALMHLSPLPLPQFASLQMGGSALLFAAGLVLACALLFSLVPAVESRRTQLNESLRMNSAQVAGGRNLPQKSLVVGEVAISLVLMVAAGLLLTSFWKLVHVSPGFELKNVLTFKTSFSRAAGSSPAPRSGSVWTSSLRGMRGAARNRGRRCSQQPAHATDAGPALRNPRAAGRQRRRQRRTRNICPSPQITSRPCASRSLAGRSLPPLRRPRRASR